MEKSVLQARKSRYFDRWWILVAAVVLLILLLVFLVPKPYKDILVFVRNGIWTTIYITLVSFLLVLFFGLLVALARLSRSVVVKGISTVYVEVVRGIPMMVQLIFWYFAFPALVQNIGDTFKIASLSQYNAEAIYIAILGLSFVYSA